MSILDGEIRALFGEVFGAIYDDGTLSYTTLTPQPGGTNTQVTENHPVKVQQDACTEAQRGEDGYQARDVRMFVLRSGLPVTITTDCRISAYGKTWLIQSVATDPAMTYWDLRAREKT